MKLPDSDIEWLERYIDYLNYNGLPLNSPIRYTVAINDPIDFALPFLRQYGDVIEMSPVDITVVLPAFYARSILERISVENVLVCNPIFRLSYHL